MENFKCKRCGKCCGIVPFSKTEYKEVQHIAQKLHISFIKNKIGDKTIYFPKRTLKNLIQLEKDNSVDLTCPFLKFEGMFTSCLIYEKRPEICRLFGKGGHPYLICPNNLIMADSPQLKKEV